MQALDNFLSPIPSFDGDIYIPVVLVSVQPPSDESVGDPSVGATNGKQPPNPTPQKKDKNATGKSSSGIKINEPTAKAPASTPPSGPQQKILIHRSKRYIRHEYFSSLTTL
jgi:hypothetical protein